jgi:hypothetical protein
MALSATSSGSHMLLTTYFDIASKIFGVHQQEQNDDHADHDTANFSSVHSFTPS